MLFTEGVNELKGHLSIRVYRCGQLYQEEETDNLIVTQGRLNLAKLLSGETGMHISHVGIGTGTDAAVSTDTDLTEEVLIAISDAKVATGLTAPDGTTFDDPRVVQFHFRIGLEVGVGMTIGEYGLYAADGTLFSRIVRASTFTKTSIDAIEGYWQIQF